MAKVVVLGCGLVGRAMAYDMNLNHDVLACDLNPGSFIRMENDGIRTLECDLSDRKEVEKAVKDSDLVIGAVPGFMGLETLKSVISCGKNIVDISFFPEDSLDHDGFVRDAGLTAVVDCGVAPGMSNFILGYHNKRMDVEYFEFMVGGLPAVRKLPFQYKAPFSPIDVIEEYTRPARLKENGKIIIKDAMSDVEQVHFEEAGTLEAFNTDGLRTLLTTMDIPTMKEKTLRWPGHIEKMKFLSEAGFFSTGEIEINGTKITPVEATAKIILPQWKLLPGEEEFTIMRIIIRGKENGKKVEYVYNLFDKYDPETGFSSMARTTGFTATAAANLFLEGGINKKGVVPPEYIGEDENSFNYVINYLKSRNVIYDRQFNEID